MQPRSRAQGLLIVPLLAFLAGLAPASFLTMGEAGGSGQDAASAPKKQGAKATSKKKRSSKKGAAKGAAASASNKVASAGSASGGAGGTAKSGTATKKAGSKKKSSKQSASKRKPARQASPDSDRIREIQKALNDHGYPVESSGVWDAHSVEALKKFQEDQKIENLSGRGKLDSMTLIALGLGPQREPPPGSGGAPKRSQEGPIP